MSDRLHHDTKARLARGDSASKGRAATGRVRQSLEDVRRSDEGDERSNAALPQAFSVSLNLPPAILSPNVRSHWAVKAKAVKKYREECAWLLKLWKPRGWVPGPVVIDMEYRAFRGCGGYHAFDIQNAIAATKNLVDGLQDAGIIKTDSRMNLMWGCFDLLTTKRQCKTLGAGITLSVRRA